MEIADDLITCMLKVCLKVCVKVVWVDGYCSPAHVYLYIRFMKNW